CIIAYYWIINIYINPLIYQNYGVCFSKKIYGITCPACGTTRSVLFILKGEMRKALYMNPLGFIALTFVLITPFGIAWDLLKKRNDLQKLYLFFESKLKEPKYITITLILIIANWIWNFIKHN
ncbi:MAG: DUF2752 domain-containing protein, partial [Crocinitomicaceae bacterium]|nr:DUF2752 domain-containing protein [Crocinitomicaceae bacterium]